MTETIQDQKGFTLIELVLVITILGMLTIAALPTFIDISTNAARASRDGTVGAVRDGIMLFRANNYVQSAAPGVFPTNAQMDSQGIGPCTACFNGILQNPLEDSRWSKAGGNTWTYNDGSALTTYTYDAVAGTFR